MAPVADPDQSPGVVGGSSGGARLTAPAVPAPGRKTPGAAPSATGAAGPGATGGGAGAGPGSAVSTGPATTPTSSPVPTAGTRSPVVVASVGVYSGPVGQVMVPMLQAIQAWVTSTNDKGGLNGHPIRLLVFDDGADPARSRAQVQEAVERHHAIAFVQMAQAISGRSGVDYITSKRIPVIGSEGGSPWFYESPMYFPQTSSGDSLVATTIHAAATVAVPEGKTKLGWVNCSENENCRDAPERVWSQWAPRLGFEVVYHARSSLAQPDFTAECLSARNAGAEVLLLALDTNSVGRLALACARQGYHPIYSLISGTIAEAQKDDPNLEGTVGPSTVFPWFQSGTPATDEYQRVMQTFGKSVRRGVGLATGWVTAKLFEKAGSSLPEPPTSESILRGLWALRNDDLGGITQPLTFNENQLASPMICFWTLRTKGGSWTNVAGGRRHCV